MSSEKVKVRVFHQGSKISDTASPRPVHQGMSKEPSEMVDLEDRDPNKLSQHIQISWDDVIGEPLTIRSPECAWTLSNQCFRFSRNCCYTCMSVLCAPVTAFCLGITFACLAFEHIWCLNPCLRIWKISCGATRNFVMAFTHAFVIPCTSACGHFWSEIKVTNFTGISGEIAPQKKDDFLII